MSQHRATGMQWRS